MDVQELQPDDIRMISGFVNAVVTRQKRDDQQGNLAENFFLIGLALGQRNPALAVEAAQYVKYTRGSSLDEMVESFVEMFRNITAQLPKAP
jgi:hypothetical protein